MRVLIATQPLGLNYGGILQAYALQKVVRRYASQTVTTTSEVNFHPKHLVSKNNWVRRLFGRAPLHSYEVQAYNTRKFIQRHLQVIPVKEAKRLTKSGYFNLAIVGSDQVWRKAYANVLDNMFAYIGPDRVTKLSYAASFGRSDLEGYSPRLLKKTKTLASDFAAISVRESSAIKIVEDNWDLHASRHIDPTMLLQPKDYESLIENPVVTLPDLPSFGIFTYLLDSSDSKSKVLNTCASLMDCDTFQLISRDGNEGSTLPPVEVWLKCFKQCRLVVTDSFHGTVFSILFNKPFLCLLNEDRGAARFETLLSTFGLEDRLITNEEGVAKKLSDPIDWKTVNEILREERQNALNYLEQFLVNER